MLRETLITLTPFAEASAQQCARQSGHTGRDAPVREGEPVRATSRFAPVQAGESGGAHSQRACRRYAASPPWTAAGRRTFIGAGYRRAAQDILASLAASYLTLGTPNEAVLAHSVGFFRQDSEVDVGLVYADYYLLEAISRMRSACPWARACGRRCHRPRRSR